MIDRYTKVVLTIIAVALSVIAIRQSLSTAIAMGGNCGAPQDPCYVADGGNFMVWVRR